MQSVGLIERWVSRNAIQEKWVKIYSLPARNFREQRIETSRVFITEIARRSHTGQENGAARYLQFLDNLFEILSCQIRVYRPQCVVGAQLDDGQIVSFSHQPI